MPLLTTILKTAGVITPSSLIVAQAYAQASGSHLSVEGVAVSFAGLIFVAMTGTIGANYVATREVQRDVKNWMGNFERVAQQVETHGEELRELHEGLRLQEQRCGLLHNRAVEEGRE